MWFLIVFKLETVYFKTYFGAILLNYIYFISSNRATVSNLEPFLKDLRTCTKGFILSINKITGCWIFMFILQDICTCSKCAYIIRILISFYLLRWHHICLTDITNVRVRTPWEECDNRGNYFWLPFKKAWRAG